MEKSADSKQAVELKGTRDQIYSQISGNKDSEAFFLKTKPNVMMFVVLLNETKIKDLYISEGIYRTIPQKVMKSLKKSVNLVVKKCRRGRPHKYSEEEIRRILQESGSNDEKMKKLGMPRRTFFYWKRKLGFSKKRKRK
ncbi:hypothetical protein JW721_02325 [Candidatus Micrarchaeota archaeon]|nr:hypothetical protein [Candidatus Micrarchaeota archaeon]